MTAIAGVVRLDQTPVDRSALERVQAVLAPYGRDAQHRWQQGEAGFVRTLLRTTPEDSMDRQPLHDAESQTVLLFDGRLDNREELARGLGLDAASLARMADSALALGACLRWDTDAPKRMLGDFAIACWQPARRRLWLARDPLGIRPLYWHRHAGAFVFASMPKGLFAWPWVPRALDEAALHDYLCLLPQDGANTLFRDIQCVEPGQVLVLDAGKVTTQRYHDFDARRELRLSSDGEYLEAFREQLDRAVACRLRTTGRVASHLSSGFDSSTIAAIAARQLAGQGKGLLAYTAVPREGYAHPVRRGRHGDESDGARALAARFANIEHVLIRSGGTSPVKGLEAAIERLDSAVRNPCNQVWIHAIEADAAARGAKVLLTGQLGNVSISYTGEQRLPALLAQGRWLTWWREMNALRRRAGHRALGLTALSFGPYVPAALWHALRAWRGKADYGSPTDYSAIHPGFMARMGTRKRAGDLGWDLDYRPWASGRNMRIAMLERVDLGNHFAATQAMGLDMRDPTADVRLIEFGLAVPDSQYLNAGRKRWLLTRLMADVLPPEILNARSKGLQAADWHEGAAADLQGLRDAWQQMAGHPGIAGYLDLEAMGRALENWPEGGWHEGAVTNEYRLKLMRGMSVGTFIRYVDDRN
ncbi:Asparagine synthetase [glutamine-hydrolyzing] 3 [Pigmentiphaga humi]|uniref:asparagine synthase (glutamine-hydrolyzing) n=1 Tax=Pigmentiphaga humi TaxID=2478468 RepID=A0A3P4B3D9_9BURK|nr:asparagine synthetase B [Pigmentiphaga humi]VCU70046.1 Asparagine synthetase [glutamine-hydrolyzing] 3 [Pigmentiphaga humi]